MFFYFFVGGGKWGGGGGGFCRCGSIRGGGGGGGGVDFEGTYLYMEVGGCLNIIPREKLIGKCALGSRFRRNIVAFNTFKRRRG